MIAHDAPPRFVQDSHRSSLDEREAELDGTPPFGIATATVVKNRRGAQGSVDLGFVLEYSRFLDGTGRY